MLTNTFIVTHTQRAQNKCKKKKVYSEGYKFSRKLIWESTKHDIKIMAAKCENQCKTKASWSIHATALLSKLGKISCVSMHLNRGAHTDEQ